MRLEGKVAIVTGSAQGIGGACASRLAAEGAALVVVDIHEAMLTAKVDEIEAAGGQALGIRCDVSDQAQVNAMLEQTIA
ncbi:MAG: SDR family NAD(P)-dependent oxidoreductase, partial [Anaerolineales bacterium]|nr:SDR family NAD(P)-dependent oxidoreductase [Anaerolineales bacterium]